jgi:4-carboxymuconolactone decarboxylase
MMNNGQPDVAKTRAQRFADGMAALNQIDEEGGPKVVAALDDISPELGHSIVAWGFGDIYSRPGLGARDRQLVTLGILTALGDTERYLNVHINAALNVGLSPDEIVEALLHAAVYCGMPRAINATLVAKKVFSDRGLMPLVSKAR